MLCRDPPGEATAGCARRLGAGDRPCSFVRLGHPDVARPALPVARGSAWLVLGHDLDGRRALVRRLAAVHRGDLHLRPAARRTPTACSSTRARCRRSASRRFSSDGRSRRCGCRSISGTAPNDLHWWDYAAWFLYLTHFFVTFIAAAAIWAFAHDKFAPFATDGLRPRADGLRDLRALSGGAAVDGGAAREPRRVEPDDRLDLAPRPVHERRRRLRARQALREQRRGDAVAARRVRAALHPLSSGGSSRAGGGRCSRSIRWRWPSRSSTRASTTSSTASPAGGTRSSRSGRSTTCSRGSSSERAALDPALVD